MAVAISQLPPHFHYVLAIDESGTEFRRGGNGRLVGLVTLGGRRVLSDLFACDKVRKRQSALDEILGSTDIGALGLASDQLPLLAGDQWLGGVLQLTTWVLLMLPSRDPCKLEVLVEQRGKALAGDTLPGAVQLIQERLGPCEASRASTRLEIKVVAKGANRLLAAADVLSHTWNDGEAAARGLRESGLLGTCLFETDQHDLPRCLDLALRPRVRGEDWRWLLSQLGAETVGSPAAITLERISKRLTKEVWLELVSAASAHLDSGRVDLVAARREAEWLDTHRPAGAELPRSVALVLEIGRLALENHRGETEVGSIVRRVTELADAHFEENPSLVCLADLYLAVQATHHFDFQRASSHLARWTGQHLAVGGLRMRARVESSLGQHRAFEGQLQEAARHLEFALDMFGRLSEPAQVARERDQTAAYLAIVSMDAEGVAGEVARQRVESVIGDIRVVLMGGGTVYHHHLAVRWLVHRDANPELIDLYLSMRLQWAAGEYHPWPMIEAYRALLIHPRDPRLALEHLDRGRAFALREEVGPILWLQGAAMACVQHQWGQRWDGLDEQLTIIGDELPLARPRVEHLRGSLVKPMKPLEILRGALPFNFR